MKKIFYLAILFSFVIACNESPKQSKKTETPAAQTQTPAVQTISYPSVPKETIQMLYDKCDYIDFVYYYMDFSMNQSDQANIRGTLSHISAEVPQIDPACQPIGRVFYQVDGVNALEGDLYMDDKCKFMVFYKDGKKAYANKLTPTGVRFYTQIFSRVKGN